MHHLSFKAENKPYKLGKKTLFTPLNVAKLDCITPLANRYWKTYYGKPILYWLQWRTLVCKRYAFDKCSKNRYIFFFFKFLAKQEFMLRDFISNLIYLICNCKVEINRYPPERREFPFNVNYRWKWHNICKNWRFSLFTKIAPKTF